MSERRVLIVGGGIAGLTLSVALAEAGGDVLVVDSRPDWDIPGWGLTMTGPMLRALDALDLAGPCLEAGYGITKVTNCTAAGDVVNVITPPLLNGPGRPAMAGIFRPVLHRVLRDRAAAAGVEVRLATTFGRMQQDDGRVGVTFDDRSEAEFDLVVGADGVRSATREQLGITASRRPTGQVVWRALVDRPEWGTSTHTFAGPTYSAGLIPISQQHAYVFLTETKDDPERIADDQLPGRMRELLADFSGPIGEVREQIVDPDSIVRRPVEVLIVPAPWHRGGVVLIGDAAHSPSPQLISGAALAVEDAHVLSEELVAEASVEEALAAFSRRRYERCRLVVDNSAQIAQWERERRRDEMLALQGETFAALAAAI